MGHTWDEQCVGIPTFGQVHLVRMGTVLLTAVEQSSGVTNGRMIRRVWGCIMKRRLNCVCDFVVIHA